MAEYKECEEITPIVITYGGITITLERAAMQYTPASSDRYASLLFTIYEEQKSE